MQNAKDVLLRTVGALLELVVAAITLAIAAASPATRRRRARAV